MAAHVKNRQSDYRRVYVWSVMQTSLHWVNRESYCGLGNDLEVGWRTQEAKQRRGLGDGEESVC